jgi:WD40 repeat protein
MLCMNISTKVTSGSHYETIKLWDVKTGESLTTLRDRPYENMNITGIRGLRRLRKPR